MSTIKFLYLVFYSFRGVFQYNETNEHVGEDISYLNEDKVPPFEKETERVGWMRHNVGPVKLGSQVELERISHGRHVLNPLQPIHNAFS
jgi:hypothetical protein